MARRPSPGGAARAGRTQGLEEPVGPGRRDRPAELDHAGDEQGDPRAPRRRAPLRPERRLLHRHAVLGRGRRPAVRDLDDPHAAGLDPRQPLRRRRRRARAVLVLRRLDPPLHPLRDARRHAQPPRPSRHVLERLDRRQGSRQPHLDQGRPRQVPADHRPRRSCSTSRGCTASTACPTATRITPRTSRTRRRKQGVEIRRRSVVLVRTGRMTVWPDFDGYLLKPPGINLPAAKWLCEETGAMCIAGDSIGLEVMPWDEPDAFLPVHAYMFATAGAQIIEVVDMEEIAAEKQYEFAFLGFPMKLRGATGAPMPSLRGAAEGLRPPVQSNTSSGSSAETSGIGHVDDLGERGGRRARCRARRRPGARSRSVRSRWSIISSSALAGGGVQVHRAVDRDARWSRTSAGRARRASRTPGSATGAGRRLAQPEADGDGAGDLDRRPADLAVALREVEVADREQRAGDVDRAARAGCRRRGGGRRGCRRVSRGGIVRRPVGRLAAAARLRASSRRPAGRARRAPPRARRNASSRSCDGATPMTPAKGVLGHGDARAARPSGRARRRSPT